MWTVEQVADWFLSRDSMTPKKLQKLVYYAYSWYLVLNNEPSEELSNRLFNERIEAWVHGPVAPEIYHRYKTYRYNEIDQTEDNSEIFDEDTLDLLEQVWDVYGGYNGNELESITHQEKPWQETRKGYEPLEVCQEVIPDDVIYNYYLERSN